MNKKLKRIVFIIMVLFISSAINAQTNNQFKSDSLKYKLLNEFYFKLYAIELQRIKDSIKKSEIEANIEILKTSDSFNIKKFQNDFKGINNNNIKTMANELIKMDSLKLNTKPYPVLGFFKDTLFLIYHKLGSFTARDRALAITERIKKLKNDYSFSDKTLSIIESDAVLTEIIYKDNILMSISKNDALWNNNSARDLAIQYRNIITHAVLNYQNETNLITLFKEIGLALLVLSILILLIYFISKITQRLTNQIKKQEGKKIKGFKIKNYTLLDTTKQTKFLIGLVIFLKWFIYSLFIYSTLPLIFGLFPWTQNFAQTLFGYIFNPLKRMGIGLWNYLPNLFTIMVIFLVFRYALKGIHYLKSEIEEGKLRLSGFYPDWANPTFQILRVVLYAFMFVLIFPYLPGSDSPIFQGVSVFLGFLFTFGSAGSLSNVVAGIVLTYMRLFKLGDRVQIGNVVGDIVEKSMLVTRVRTIKNEIISIPNSTVMSSHTTNFSNEATIGEGLIIHTTVTIGYDVPWKEMDKVLIKAANRTDHILKQPQPFVLQTSLDDFYVSYQINAYTKEPNKQAGIYSQLHQNIQDCCNEVGIEILSPHYRANRNGNATTIPEPYLNKNFKS